MTIESNISWLDVKNINYDPEISIYFCADDPYMERPEGIARFIGIQAEPNAIWGLRDAFIQNHAKYDILLTFDEEILKICPNARLYLYGTTWIPKEIYENIDTSIKKRRISSLTGAKCFPNARGHQFRQDLYFSQKHCQRPIDWYRSGNDRIVIREFTRNQILGDSKLPLFINYQFSLVIENSRQANYFSEKLLDCLLTKTIPIYYGCPNISNWFDTTGWILLETESVSDCFETFKNIPDYESHTEVINKNYEAAKKFVNFTKNICHAIGFSFKSPN
jgi:hypothetical protein